MKKRKKRLIIIPLCVVALCAAGLGIYFAANDSGGEADNERILGMMSAEVYKSAQGKLPYRVYVPRDYDPAREYPLVLYLHHVARRGRDNRAQMRDNYAQFLLSEENLEKYPCIFLAPQCPKNQAWVPGHDEGFADNAAAVMGLLEQTKAAYSVDEDRIYITGMSMGGFGTWGMLRAYPDYFAAAVPICGGWLQKSDVEYTPLLKGVPIWAFHGALDTAVPVERTRDMVEALQAVGGNVKYTEYPEEGHLIGEKVYSEPELFPWMFAQSRSVAVTSADPVDMMEAQVYKGLPYRIYVPENLDNEAKVPLVLCLHGSGNCGDDNLAQLGRSSAVHTLLAPENLVKYPCIVIAPQCPEGQRWVRGYGQYDLPGNTGALMGLLEQMRATYPVDPARIYITGLSMGGFGTWGMLRAYPDYFAAAVPICGGWDLPDDLDNAPRMKDIPIWVFHGALDDDVPVERSRDMVRAIEDAGGNIKYTEYPDGWHPIWDRVYSEPELFPWLFAQKRD